MEMIPILLVGFLLCESQEKHPSENRDQDQDRAGVMSTHLGACLHGTFETLFYLFFALQKSPLYTALFSSVS